VKIPVQLFTGQVDGFQVPPTLVHTLCEDALFGLQTPPNPEIAHHAQADDALQDSQSVILEHKSTGQVAGSQVPLN